MAEVSFICKRTVVSTKPVEPGKFTPLSALDRIMERNHLRAVFYYNFPAGRRDGELTRKLRDSISDMLTAFPVVTGRLVRTPEGHWRVKCNDAGLRMVEAKVRGTLHEWLQNVNRETELKLVHWEEMFHKPYFWSPFYVQITEFEEGGLAIGLSCTHLLCDPICATMMIKAWADTALRGEITYMPSFHSLPPRKQENRITYHQPYLINHYRTAIENPAPTSDTKHTTVTLQFNQEMVTRCMSVAGKATANESITPFQVLAALFWTRISWIKGMQNALISMSICSDMRNVLGLEKGFFGNCMVYNAVEANRLDHEDEACKAAVFIKEALSRMDRDEVLEIFEWLEREKCGNSPLMNGSRLIFVDLENAELCSAIFEGGSSLVRASYYIEPAVGMGQVVIIPAPGGDGPCSRVVAVTLPEDEAEKLLEDAWIQEYEPTVLMGLSKKSNKKMC